MAGPREEYDGEELQKHYDKLDQIAEESEDKEDYHRRMHEYLSEVTDDDED